MVTVKVNGDTLVENPELIIFDKDGTLIDVHFYWGSIIRLRSELICARLAANVADRITLENKLSEAMGLDLKAGMLKRMGPVGIKPRPYIIQVVVDALRESGIETNNEQIDGLFREVDHLSSDNLARFIKILPDVEGFLNKAHAAGIKLAVGTTDRTDRAIETLKCLKIDGLFSAVLGGDLLKKHKPEPETIFTLTAQLDVAIDKTVMVGDHAVDIQMGINAKAAKGIGVLTGLGTREDFNGLPCSIAKTFKDVEVI